MPYGTIKVDNITFTNGGSDTTITVSGLASSTTGNLTVTGTISGAVVRATTVSGVTVTGTTVQGASGTFTSITGGVATITSGVFAAGSATNPSISFTGDNNTGIYSPGADQVAISTGGSGRLFVNSAGDIGIGAAPSGSYKLEVKGGAIDSVALFDSTNAVGPHIRFSTSGTDRHYLGSSPGFTAGGTSSDFGIRTAGYFEVLTGGNNPRLRVTSAGLVGVGTSSPTNTAGFSQQLQLTGNLPCISIDNTGTGANKYSLGVNSVGALGIWDNTASAFRMYINSSGQVGIGTTSPGGTLDVGAVAGAVTAGDLTVTTGSTTAKVTIGRLSSTSNDFTVFRIRDRIDRDVLTVDQSNFVYSQTGSERARIDSSGRLLVGTSTSRSNFFNTTAPAQFQIEGTGVDSFASQIRNSASPNCAVYILAKSRGAAVGSNTVVQSADQLGQISFQGSDGTEFVEAANIIAEVDGTPGSNDMPGRLVFSTTADGASSPTERMRITSTGEVTINGGGPLSLTRSADTPLFINRTTNDGSLVSFAQDGVTEGSISVSGTTVSYNGAHLSRWSQLPSGAERIEILRGTVLSNINEMCEWGEESNEQLNRMKVSNVEGDKNVSGVFQAWDDDDDTYTNDFYCAMTGDFIIRIAEGVTVERGDLLMSAGDGTAKPQDDDIIRSKTIAKVTSTNVSCTYEDGSYCVPCVLMAC